jgi:pyruvate kinase
MNTIKVHFLGTILNRGHSGVGGRCSGALARIETYEDAQRLLKWDKTEIILIPYLGREYIPRLKSLKGVVVEEGSAAPPDEILREAPDIVLISKVPDALASFEDGQLVTLDGHEKIIYEGFV